MRNRLSFVFILLLFLALLGSTVQAGWLSSLGALATPYIEEDYFKLVAHDEVLRVNDFEADGELKLEGHGLVKSSSEELPGQNWSKHEIEFQFEAQTESDPANLEARLRYTNSTDTFLVCESEEIISTELSTYKSSCTGQIDAEKGVIFHYEFIGSPSRNYTIRTDGGTTVTIK